MKVKIGDLTKIRTGKLDANASSEEGQYPFFTCSREPLKISTYLKYLTGIDDQISKSAFGSEKFSDNDSHKTKSDIDFHIAYDCRNRGRQYNFCKRMPAFSVQCIYQFDLFLIDIDKGGIQIQDTSEDGDGHSGNNNCF